MTDWPKILREARAKMTFREMARQARMSEHVIYKLVEKKIDDPRHGDGERLKALCARLGEQPALQADSQKGEHEQRII